MNNREEHSSIDYKKILKRFLSFRYWYLGVGFTFFLVAFVINKYQTRTYKNHTTLLVKTEDNSSFLNSNAFNISTVGLFESANNIENELELIRSYSLIKSTISRLNLSVSYYSSNRGFIERFVRKLGLNVHQNLYKSSPIEVVQNTSGKQLVNSQFHLKFLGDNTYRLIVESESGAYLYDYLEESFVRYVDDYSYDEVHMFGERVENDFFSFTVNKTANFNLETDSEKNIYFVQNDINNLALSYMGKLTINTTSPTSTLLRISLKGENRLNITDFLNELTLSYLNRDIEKKSKQALSTIRFIDTQISDISDSLSDAENNLKRFRTANSVLDLSFQGQQFFEKLEELQTEEANLQMQKRYYDYLLDYFNKNSDIDDLPAPSSGNVIDPILTNLISKLIDLNADRMAIVNTSNSTTKNLHLNELQPQIENLKKTIVENVKNNLNNINISLDELEYRISKISGQISEMPKTELQLLGIERNFKLNDALYTFLLQKRSEAQISRASTFPDYEIVEPAQVILAVNESPSKRLNYALALILTVFLPSLLIIGVDYFDNTINERDNLSSLIPHPVLGYIYHNETSSQKVMITDSQSPISESFRAVRTNYDFFKTGDNSQVLLFTSSFSGEGKTFNAMNLALSFAINGKKTVLLEFDLRRPKIHQEFQLQNDLGLSSYLINQGLLNDVIKHSMTPNLDIITSGPLPPNPAELIASKKTAELFLELKEIYDYIIVDSPPVGVISDTYLFMRQADMNIFIVRFNKTTKNAMFNTLDKISNNGINKLAVLVNDVDPKKETTKYGYDAKYYMKSEQKPLHKKVINLINKNLKK